MDNPIDRIIKELLARLAKISKRLDRLEALENVGVNVSVTAPTNNLYTGKIWSSQNSMRLYVYDATRNYNGLWIGAVSLVKPLSYATGVTVPNTIGYLPAHGYGNKLTGVSHLFIESYQDTYIFTGGVNDASNYWQIDHHFGNLYNQDWLVGSTNNSTGVLSQWLKRGLTVNAIIPPNQWGDEYTELKKIGTPTSGIFHAHPSLLAREVGKLPPEDNGSMKCWFRSDVPCRTYAPAAAMSYWGDGGGSGLTNGQQATGANQPIWNTGITPLYPAVTFDGVNDSFLVDNPSSAFNIDAPFTIFARAKSLGSGTSGTTQVIFGKGDVSLAAGAANRRKLQIGRNGANLRVASGTDTQVIDVPCDFTTGFRTVAWVCRAANDHGIYIDSQSVQNFSTVLDLSTFNTVVPTIGQAFSTGVTENWNGQIVEIIIHTTALTDTQIQNEMAYLNLKA